MPRRPRLSEWARSIGNVARAARRIGEKLGAGLDTFNALRKRFPNLPQAILSKGYQLGKSMALAVWEVDSTFRSKRPTLSRIPIQPWLRDNSPFAERIRYRFQARVYLQGARNPRIITVDVWSDHPLSGVDAHRAALQQAEQLGDRYPVFVRGRVRRSIDRVETELTEVSRGY